MSLSRFVRLAAALVDLLIGMVLLCAHVAADGQTGPQAQDPVVTDIPSHVRGVPATQNESFDNLNILMRRYSLARIPKSERSERTYLILHGYGKTPDPRIESILTRESCDGQHGLLLHLAVWHIEPAAISDGKTPRTFALAQSEWHGFLLRHRTPNPKEESAQDMQEDDYDGWPCRLVEAERADGTPSFYRGTKIYFVGVNVFDSLFYGFRVSIDYKLDTIGIVPQNILDLAAGISAVTGVQLTPPTPAASQLTPPPVIDTGVDYPVPLALATVLTNVYQGRVNDKPKASGIEATSVRPYTLNSTFFLQFAPSLLTLTQGQILQDPATPIQSPAESTKLADTTAHLKEKLEIVARGYTATALAPLPPVLSFTSDLKQQEQALSASITPNNPASSLTLEHEAALIDAILAKEYEALAITASANAIAIQQAITSLTTFDQHYPKNEPYARGDRDLPDKLLKSFSGSMDSIVRQVQEDAEMYIKKISPAYRAFEQSKEQSDAALTTAGAALDQAARNVRAESGSNLLQQAADLARTLDGIVSDRNLLNTTAGHLSVHLDAFDQLCRKPENASEADCTEPISPNSSDKCDPYGEAVDSDLKQTSMQVAGCKAAKEAEEDALNAGVARFKEQASDVELTVQAGNNQDVAGPAFMGIIKNASTAVDSLEPSSDQILISNSQMAEARLDATMAANVVTTLQGKFKDFYEQVWAAGTPENIDQKPPQRWKGKHGQPRGAKRVTDAFVQFRDLSSMVAGVTSLAASTTEAARTTARIEKVFPVEPRLTAPTSGNCNCCCCTANSTCPNKEEPSVTKDGASIQLSPQPPTGSESTPKSPVSAGPPTKSVFAIQSTKSPAVTGADIGTAFLTSSNTGGAISGIPFRSGDFPLVMIVSAVDKIEGTDKLPAACLPPDVVYEHEQDCIDHEDHCAHYANDVPCLQFVALTTSGGGGGPGSASPSPGGAQPAGGGPPAGGGQSPGPGGKGPGGGGGGGGGASVAQSPTQAVDCSRQSSVSGPCAFTRSFTVDEPEWWDVSLGLAIPGPKEAVFSPSTTGTAATGTPKCPKGYNCGFKHHADAYALVDIYPLSQTWERKSRPLFQRDSFAPHVNFGIPITSQSLYRPYAGISENVSSPLEHRLGFPLSISIYGGVVWMKQSLCLSACVASFNSSTSSATTAAPVLPQDRALKPTFGVEVSITGIVGKLKGGGSSKAGGGGGGGGGAGGAGGL